MRVEAYIDGGSRGNPGLAAIGGVVRFYNGGVKKVSFSRCIGETTNNVAEYSCLIEALKVIKEEGGKVEGVVVYMDSLLVVNQVNGLFKVKNSRLRELLMKVRVLEGEIGVGVECRSVPRERNKEADSLVNKAMDEWRQAGG